MTSTETQENIFENFSCCDFIPRAHIINILQQFAGAKVVNDQYIILKISEG